MLNFDATNALQLMVNILNRCRIKCVNIGGDVLCRPIAIDWKGVE